MSVQRYICERCGGRADAPGDCSSCPDEPMLDLASEDIRIMIDELDDKRKHKRQGLFLLISLAACSPVFMFGELLPTKLVAVGYGGAALGLAGGLYWLFPAKTILPDFTDKTLQEFAELTRG